MVVKINWSSVSPIEMIKASSRVNLTQKKVPVSENDKVAVSGNLQVYQSLLQKMKEIPAVREDLVRSLTEQIERGEFAADSKVIADKLFSNEL